MMNDEGGTAHSSWAVRQSGAFFGQPQRNRPGVSIAAAIIRVDAPGRCCFRGPLIDDAKVLFIYLSGRTDGV
jgi:hypothetical protein